ncbi:MAG: hypothetical protein MRY83_19590 [Flavobacteriales bacterium]|nr:hypothetical protein [Flavobacteriales bacterium]
MRLLILLVFTISITGCQKKSIDSILSGSTFHMDRMYYGGYFKRHDSLIFHQIKDGFKLDHYSTGMNGENHESFLINHQSFKEIQKHIKPRSFKNRFSEHITMLYNANDTVYFLKESDFIKLIVQSKNS